MVTVGPFIKERVEEVEYMCIVAVVLLLVRLVVLERLNPVWMISVAGDFL
jgi:hypothetical protein